VKQSRRLLPMLSVELLLCACEANPARVPPERADCGNDYFPLDHNGKWLPSGSVGLRLCIGPDNHITALEVAATSGIPAMDQAAMRCVAAGRYRAATRAGVPVEACQLEIVRVDATSRLIRVALQ